MGVMAVTGLYDITLIGAPPAWARLGLARSLMRPKRSNVRSA